ncbi:MAG TPA: type II secretion system protein, partial [Candidatus Saccharimonadales bacterium]|nr:type II secretion system protein [Candidatus Saccharimonadales bacterium]
MDRRAGFTLIELLITIIVMVILVTLAVVSLRGNQQHARDEKRKSDVAAIAQQLESYYTTGSDPISTYAAGEYPPTILMDTEVEVKAALRDLDPKALRAPDVGTAAPMSFTVATTTTEPTPNVSTYVYMPLTIDNTLCQNSAQECRKFILYYALEGTGGIQK